MFISNNLRETSNLSLKDKVIRARNYQERSVPKFLKKVFHILEENKFTDYVSWSNDGCAIVLKKPTEFAEQVLPLYFKHNNFASFVRQLNMYNFKKRKNYHYDHVYGHEMFQRGRIDLLKNISRKCAENTIEGSNAGLKSPKDDLEIDVDTLITENLQYKRVHKTLSTQLQFIENKMIDLKTEIHVLHSQHKQQQANEAFLKNVVKNLSTIYGVDNIQRAIEAASYDCSWASESENAQDLSQEPSYNNKNTYNHSYVQHNVQKEITPRSQLFNTHMNLEDSHQRGTGYATERDLYNQFTKKSATFNNAFNDQESNIENLPLPRDFEPRDIFDNDNNDAKLECDKSTSSDTYMSWYLEFEKNQISADAFLGNHAAANTRDNGNLDIDGPISTENQLNRADF